MTINQEKQCFTVYSQRLAGYLMQRGFKLRHLAKDEVSKKHLFLFANTEELQTAINEWKNSVNRYL